MDKQVIYKQSNSFIIADKNIKEFELDTEVDLLTVTEKGNIIGRNMYLGSILNHCPYMKPAEISDMELKKMLANVTSEHDYGADREKAEKEYNKLN